jgi:hypothetical protein
VFTLGEIISNGTYTAHQSSTYPKFEDYESNVLKQTTTYQANTGLGSWRTTTAGEPIKFMVDYNTGYITVYPKPDNKYLIRLSVVRYPITALSATSMSSQTPEINSKHHHTLVNGICALAYLKNGETTYDERKATTYMSLYNKSIADFKMQTVLNEGTDSTIQTHKGFM